jgi:beta-galactosidase
MSKLIFSILLVISFCSCKTQQIGTNIISGVPWFDKMAKHGNYMKHIILFILLTGALLHPAQAQYRFDNILYGAAYYHEYMPAERLDEDIRMMKDAGLTVVRVGESSWGLFEPQEGVFDFAWMDRILDKMHTAGIKVIFGTPTYSIPAWMAHRYPEVLAEHTKGGKEYYGIRQNMDFTNPTYRFFCERIIRKLMQRYAKHPAIIGYQVDNEVEAGRLTE